MRFQKFLKEDVVSKALAIPEPEYKKQYDPDIAERYLDTLQIAIQRLREKYKDKDYDPEKDVDDPKLSADEAKLKDLQDKYNKWEEIAGADDEAEGEEPADEDPTSDPGEDPGDMPEEGEEDMGDEEFPPEEDEELPPEEDEEEPPKKKKKVEEKRKTNKLKAIFDIPGRDDPTSEDDPDPVDADGSEESKYPLSPDEKREKEQEKEQKEREKELDSYRKADKKDDQMRRKKNMKMRQKMQQERLIKSKIKMPGK